MFEHRRRGVNDWQRSGRRWARRASASPSGSKTLHDEADPGHQQPHVTCAHARLLLVPTESVGTALAGTQSNGTTAA
jgi:hypothetical protein